MPDAPPHAAPDGIPPRPPALTDFAPVPRQFDRADTWTPEVQRAFIEWLADLGSVTEACRMVGRSTTGAYRLKRHPEAGEFAAAWAAALAIAVGMVEDNAIDRAINGVEVPVLAYGKTLATRRVHNDRLAMFMLRNHAPERYCEGGARAMSAVDKRVIARLKKEWEAERAAEEHKEAEQARAEIDAMLESMARNRKANMSPAQRAAEIAARAQALADDASGWHPGGPYREYAEKAAELLPHFIAEVEKDWPPLPDWAWDDPADADTPRSHAPIPDDPIWQTGAAPGEAAPKALPAPDGAETPSGPRIRTIKDEGW
jgi:hypothetical protein